MGVPVAAQLTPQGKTQGLFRVIRTENNSFVLYADDGDRSALLIALKKYLVADQVVVTDLTEADGAKVFHVTDGFTKELPPTVLSVDTWRGFDRGIDLVCLNAEAVSVVKGFLAGNPIISDGERNAARFRAGVPAFPKSSTKAIYLVKAESKPLKIRDVTSGRKLSKKSKASERLQRF